MPTKEEITICDMQNLILLVLLVQLVQERMRWRLLTLHLHIYRDIAPSCCFFPRISTLILLSPESINMFY